MSLEAKIAHLGFIQGVINRMGSNSFVIKGWAVTLAAAIFALAAKESNPKFIYLSFFPVLCFWLLDAYFLLHEKRFRELYRRVAFAPPATDFSLSTAGIYPGKLRLFWAAISPTLLSYYGLIIFLVLWFMWKIFGFFANGQ